MDNETKIFITGLVFYGLFFIYVEVCKRLSRRRNQKLPPGPKGLPLVGYLPFLGHEPHLKLHELAKKYGDIFGLYMGTTYVVVVADFAAAKEILSKPSTTDRPPNFFHFMPGGAGFAEMKGAEWLEQRRYTMQKMKNLGLGNSQWEKMVQTEVKSFLDLISEWEGKPLDIVKPLSASLSNNVLSLVSGHWLPMGDPKRDIVDKGVEAFELIHKQSGLVALYPKIAKIAVKLGLVRGKDMLEAMIRFNKYVKQNVADLKNAQESQSYIYEYLMEIEKNKSLNSTRFFSESNLVGNVQALIIAGSDTTKVSLLWLFLAMAAFPDIQDKVQAEIDNVLGRDGEPKGWMDRQSLSYCHATIMEAQRWRTVVPLNLMHRTNSDTAVGEFVVPAGSNIVTLIWAMHNDERHWDAPHSFRPERFLDQDGKVLKNVKNYAPFSIGKRFCIGETVANIEIFLYFVGVMQKFRIHPASENTPLVLNGTCGLTLQPPKQPLRYVPR